MKTEQEIFDELLQGFMNKIIQWSSPFSESNLKFVYNQNLDNLQFDKVKYILVGDNPGENELKQEKYLVGEAGLMAKCFFKSELGINSFEDEVLVLNKTPIYSKQTRELNDLYKENKKIIEESQIYMCNLI